MPDFPASVALRQAAISAAVVLVAILAFAGLTLVTVAAGARADLARTIDTDIAGLADIMFQGGPGELRKRIGDRLALEGGPGDRAFYGLYDAGGRRLAGNLPIESTFVTSARTSQIHEVTLAGGGPILLRSTRMRGDLVLAVGRSRAAMQATLAQLRAAFALLATVTTALTLAIALVAARRHSSRLIQINAMFERFSREGETAPVAHRVGGDEIDQLVRHVDAYLQRIKRLLTAQREMSDNIAHELRTPLVHLDGELLRALDMTHDKAVVPVLHAARADIRSIVALFDALLDIALVEAPIEAERATVVDLSEMVARLGELYAASAEEAGLDFSTRIASGVTMPGDEMQLSRMIANLLDNALKYAPMGSTIRLILTDRPAFVVQDDGPGIAPDLQEAVFGRFRRANSERTGHGLGLALVAVIAARHRMRARVEDAGPGARFVIEPTEIL